MLVADQPQTTMGVSSFTSPLCLPGFALVQFDTYREMQQLTGDQWDGPCLRTNCLWVSYLAEVLAAEKIKGQGAVAHKRLLREFRCEWLAWLGIDHARRTNEWLSAAPIVSMLHGCTALTSLEASITGVPDGFE